ncbi:MAG TPA: endonuclease/exonuclease/phosphatase family protein [Terriglobales bacterium]|nr:endonuclease/exonuclease/phosphatase family protein [Terriglobales bacterium]
MDLTAYHQRPAAARRVLLVLSCLALLLATPAPAYSQDGNGRRTVKVLTYNMDEGTDYLEVVGAATYGTFSDFTAAVQLTWDNVQASDPGQRAELLATQIVGAQPDLVSLQEVTTWFTGTLNGLSCQPTAVQIHALSLLMDALERHGGHYKVLAQVPEFALGGPFPDLQTCVAALNEDVILGRVAGESEKLAYDNIQFGHYAYQFSLPSPIGAIEIPRGWASVDVSVAGQPFRFINTHLEDGTNPLLAPLAAAQAVELITGPGATAMPVIIAGDFNSNASNPDDPSYQAYQAITALGGFSDAWLEVHPTLPGYTWGVDGILPNPDYTRTQRIDLILTRGLAKVLTAAVVGGAPHDRVDGYWPSDHAGVAAWLQLP